MTDPQSLPRLSNSQAAHLRAILAAHFGGYYDGFERYLTEPAPHGHEWRFGGWLGFGGKLHVSRTIHGIRAWVSCYPEHETDAARGAIREVNETLKAYLEPQEADSAAA